MLGMVRVPPTGAHRRAPGAAEKERGRQRRGVEKGGRQAAHRGARAVGRAPEDVAEQLEVVVDKLQRLAAPVEEEERAKALRAVRRRLLDVQKRRRAESL